MKRYNHLHKLVPALFVLCAISPSSQADQWGGNNNKKGKIWRQGPVVIGNTPAQTNVLDTDAMLELIRPIAATGIPIFSANSSYNDTISTVFQVDTKGVYVGGAVSRAENLPSGNYDFAVGRGAVIGMNNIPGPVPSGYSLAVGGSILADEIRVTQIGEWADYVFHPGYQLPDLSAVESFVAEYKHLPDVPSATEIKQQGVGLGEMQATLLQKIEELTLYAIEQNKTIKNLQLRLTNLEHRDLETKVQGHE